MKKRIISLILALTLCVGMLPAPAWAEEPTDPTQAVEAVGAANPSEETDPTTEPTEAETEPTEAETEPTEAETEPTEAETDPAEETAAPGEDEAVAAVQAMIDALPDVEDMSESYLDALVAAYSAFDALSESQQAKINGVEKLEALFGWVNSQVSTLAAEETISGEKTWNNRTFTTPVKLTGDTTLTLVGDNKIECDQPLDLNGKNLTIQGTGTLELVGKGGSSYRVGATLCDGTWTGYPSSRGGTLTLAGGTVKVSGSDQNAVCVYSLKLNGGNLEAYGGENAGIVCALLETTSGSLYATGKDYGISMYRPCSYDAPVNKLTILVSNKRDADPAEMESANEKAIKNAGVGEFRTVYIGEVTGPMLSVKAQKGYLYEGVADQEATFAIAARNVKTETLNAQWAGGHSGLTESLSADGKTLTVTADATVKQGTYNLTVTVTGTDETTVTKTVTVTVLGAPITVTTQPQDASASCKGGDLDSWQGDKEIQAAGTLATGLTEDITYQWKLKDGTVLDGFNQPTLSLKNLYSDKKLTPQADKSWLSSAEVYCTLTVGSYSVKTETVTLTVNTCDYQRVGHVDGKCLQCGEFHTSDPLLVSEDGYFAIVPDESGAPSNVGGHLVGGGTFFLTKDVTHRGLNAGNATKDNKDTILDLQGHTLESLDMGNFPYGSFTLKNGTLNQCIRSTATEGKLILDDVTFGDACWQAASNGYLDITVRGKTVFQANVSFSVVEGVVHLRGGTFKEGIDTSNGAQPLKLLDEGFAYQDSDGKIVDARYPENIASQEIQVVAHTCKYVNGKCACGRRCDHETLDDNGYCTFCHALVEPYAIGEVRYTSLEAALAAAKEGDIITLRGNFYQGAATVEINKNVTLELGSHTLTSDADGEPVLLILAENVTIRNGTVQNTRTAKSSPAVTVGETVAAAKAGLTVKSVTFIGSSDGNAPQEDALDIQNGHAKVESGTFNGGIFAQGDLTMTGGSATRLELGYVMGKVKLSGGSFDSISFNANPNYLGLLADGYAYQSGTGMVKPGDMDSNTAVQVVKCTHPDGLTATDECPYCGMTCGHGNINQTTGLCPECGYQMAASLTVDGKTTFFDTFPNAAAAANGKTGALLTLLKDEVVQNSISSSFGGGKITIDWKGHTLSGQPNRWNSVIALDGAAELTLRDSSGNNAGGIDNQNTEAILVRGGSLTIESGTYASQVCIPANTATVKISGGIFKNDGSSSCDYAIDTEDGRYLAELMAPGYTLALDPEGRELYDVYANKKTPEHTTVYVVSHTSHSFDKSGKCACGAGVPIQVEAGTDSFYFDDFESAVNQAKTLPGSTVRLLEDVTHSGDSGIYINSGTFTIDWNGHTLSGSTGVDLLAISQSANVTLKDSSGNNTGGVRQTGLDAAVCIAVGSEGSVNIQGGTYSPGVRRRNGYYGPVRISGGIFQEGYTRSRALYDESGRPLSGMLVDGTAFAYDADGSELLDAYHVNKSDSFRTVYAVAHTHKNWTDGVCSCGYLCPHDKVNEEGECTLCGKRFYVQGTYDDGTTHYYGTISDALEDPAVTQAKILRALTEECESWNGGGRSVTLDLNGWNLVVESIQGGHLILRDSSGNDSILGMAEIQQDGQVTVESGRLAPQGELSVYGKLTVSGGKVDSLTAMEGSTVSISGGDVGSLTAMEGSTVSLSGGTFGKIVGSGVTLKELLAEDCYYAELDGETPKKYADTDTVIEQVSVKRCDHTSVRENKGTYFTTYTCNCGKVTYLLTVTVGESDKKYFGDYNTGFAYAAKSDGVVRFLELNGTIEVNAQGMVTIDMENRSYSAYGRSLVIKSGSTVKLVGQGAVMSKPEAGGGSGSSGTREYGEFIPVTVESGGTFVLPANNLNGEPNMAKPTQLTVQSGGTAELQGGSTQWTDVYGTLKISGGSHLYIHQYEKGQLNITGGQIQLLQIYGDLPQNALSGGSYVTISVMEFRSGETEKFRDVTFADFQKMLVSGKVFQKKQDQSYPNEVEETPNYGTFNYVKELNKVNVTAAPFTGVQAICQLGDDTYEEQVSTQYNVGETDSSGNVVFRLGVNIQSQEAQPGVTVQWYELGAEDSRTPVGTGLTCPLNLRLPVGTHRFLAVVNCSGYVLESQPFAVTVTPRVVNITGGFTAQDRDYELDNPSVRIIQGEVTFDKKAEEDDLSAQVHGGTIATPDAGQNRTVDYSVTLTGEDKDNYTLGSVPELTVTIRPIAQTLTFAETAVTKTYGDSPFVNALDHSTGDGQITYTSSDPAVATVGTDGTVTILKSGTAKITAKAGATQNYVKTTASFDLTVAKAAGTLENKDYPTEFTYGDTVPTPKAENFTTNNPDGAFDYYWVTEAGTILDAGANPTSAGNYTLYVTLTEGTNHTAANLSLPVTIRKANQTANITVVNETISGKGDGGVKLLPSAEGYEMRKKGETTFGPIPASQGQTFMTLAPGITYEIRRAETKNYLSSAIQEITVQPGRKLKVTLPSPQTGYSLTADKQELGWHEDVELTFQLNPVGVYKAADFGIWAEAGSEKTKLTLGNDGAVKLTAPEKDITITVTGVKTDDREPKVYIQGRMSQDSFDYVKWEGFQENPADDFVNGNFVISATDRGSGVASLWYCLSQTPLTLAEMDTASWKQAGKVSITEDGVYYLYAKALDNANNAGYACTGKLVKESNPPTFSGVENGKTYYVSQQMEIHDDGMPDWYMAKGSIGVVPNGGNKNPIKLRLKNDGSSYTITAGDRCGNEASITVHMKPLSDLTQPLDRIQEETIRKSDRATLDEVEATLKGLDVTYATEPEKKEMNDALARIAQLRQVLDQVAAVEAQIDALPDSVEPYQQTVEDTQIKPARQAYSDLTDHQKTLVDSTKLDKLVRLEAQLNAWTITEGDGQTWYKGSWNPLSFTVNGQSRKFSRVLLDGRMSFIATPSFLAVSGSIDEPFTLTLKPELLQVSMKAGEHTLTVIYGENNSGTGTVTFTVEIPANYLDVTGKPEFDGKTTVTVDGKEYPIEEMGGERYVNLPETGDLLTIYSFKDGTPAGSHTNYPTGMQVFRITRQEGGAKAEEIPEFANLLNYAGCSIRISGKQGIRMITGIDQNVKKSLVSKAGLAGYTLEEYGTVVQWADTLGSNTLNLDNSNKQNYAYKKGKADPIFSRANGMIQYTNVLVGFSLEDCAKDLILRPYIKLKDMTTGETVTLYGGSVCRSIGYVAKQNENTYKPGSSGYKYVHTIINAVYGQEP